MLGADVLLADALAAGGRPGERLVQRRQDDHEPQVEAVEPGAPLALERVRLEHVVDRDVVAAGGEGPRRRAGGGDAQAVLLGLQVAVLRVGAAGDDQLADAVELDVGRTLAGRAPGAGERRLARAGRAAEERDDQPSS